MLTGFKREITVDDVWDLNPRDQGRRLNPMFQQYWEEEVQRTKQINKHNHLERGRRSGYESMTSNYWTNGNIKSHGHSAVSFDSNHERTTLLFAEESKISGAEVPSSEKKLKIPSLIRVLLRLIWKNILIAMIQKYAADISLFASPVLLGLLIQQLQTPTPNGIWKAYVISVGMFVSGFFKSVLFAHSMYRSILIGLHVKTVLISAIYKKALTMSNSAKKGFTVGEIVNLMSVDCQRLQEILTMFFFIWTTPVQIVFSVLLLYNTIGPSVMVGVGMLVLLVPVNTWIGSKQKLIQETLLTIKDSRIKMVNEILNGMKVLKLYAWENEFKSKVEAIRSMEVRHLYKIALLYVLSGLCWGLAPYLVGMLTFATYVLSDRTNVLDPQKAFVSLALFNLLRVPLNYVSTIIIYTVQVFVSAKRINKFLIRPDLDTSNTTWDPEAKHAVVVNAGSFTWDREYGVNLRNINLTIKSGQLTAIVGPVGAGKSSLILAILGEMDKIRGEVIVK
ncbi:Multidrug resistance-associated protein 1, partial [Bulinus truncatus]